MSRYINEAEKCLEKIKYYYDNAGPSGYTEALFYHNKLANLIGKANSSQKEKGYAPLIHNLLKQANALMAEMKKRRDEYKA